MNSINARLPLCLLLMRLGVFLVMLMWTLDKLINPSHAAAVFETFYFIGGLGNPLIYLIGAIQFIIVIAFVVGFKKKFTYAAILFLHTISTVTPLQKYFNPYEGANLLFFAAWPMLAACFTLFYLKDWDTMWAIDSK